MCCVGWGARGGEGGGVEWFYQLWLRSQFTTVKRAKSWHFERLPFVRVRQKSGEGYEKRKLRPPFFIRGYENRAFWPLRGSPLFVFFFGGGGSGGLGGLLFHFILAKIYVFRFEN